MGYAKAELIKDLTPAKEVPGPAMLALRSLAGEEAADVVQRVLQRTVENPDDAMRHVENAHNLFLQGLRHQIEAALARFNEWGDPEGKLADWDPSNPVLPSPLLAEYTPGKLKLKWKFSIGVQTTKDNQKKEMFRKWVQAHFKKGGPREEIVKVLNVFLRTVTAPVIEALADEGFLADLPGRTVLAGLLKAATVEDGQLTIDAK